MDPEMVKTKKARVAEELDELRVDSFVEEHALVPLEAHFDASQCDLAEQGPNLLAALFRRILTSASVFGHVEPALLFAAYDLTYTMCIFEKDDLCETVYAVLKMVLAEDVRLGHLPDVIMHRSNLARFLSTPPIKTQYLHLYWCLKQCGLNSREIMFRILVESLPLDRLRGLRAVLDAAQYVGQHHVPNKGLAWGDQLVAECCPLVLSTPGCSINNVLPVCDPATHPIRIVGLPGDGTFVLEQPLKLASLFSTIGFHCNLKLPICLPQSLARASPRLWGIIFELFRKSHDMVEPEVQANNELMNAGPYYEWLTETYSLTQPELFELIMISNKLMIKPLLDALCKMVANMIKGKRPDEIRTTFNIRNDFTPEEEEQVRQENEWCEER